MTQEEKDLLLKDLCARLPYGTQVYAQNDNDWYDSELCTQVLSDVINDDYVVKPYLFPLSSMTEEQKEIRDEILDSYNSMEQCYIELIDFYNKNHFDYHYLISKGLAIDATDLNIY